MPQRQQMVEMMSRWFSLRFVDQFASELLADAASVLLMDMVSLEKQRNVKKAAKHEQRREMALTTLHRRAVEFGRRDKLNFFQKARLSKQLQDGLIRCGQSAEFAKDFAVKVIADLR